MKKLKKRLLSLAMIFCMILGMISGTAVSAHAEDGLASATDITDRIVTSFEVTPDKIENTNPVTVNLTFSEEKGHEIQPGDFIQVTWTYKPNEVYFEGFQNAQELYHNGIYMADLKVEADKATIVFTEAVSSIDNISGSAEFSLKGYNLRKIEQEEAWDKAEIYCGSSTKQVEIRTFKTGDPIFFGKVGTMYEDSSDQVYWWLKINEPKFEVTQDLIINDEIQAGQKYSYLESVRVVTSSGSDITYYPEDDDTFRTAYPNIVYTQTEQNISISIPKEYLTQTQFEFNYVVDITKDLPYFENNANAKGQYLDKNNAQPTDVNKGVTAQVKNITFGGDISGTVRGELKIVKIADDGKETPIPGVKFLLKSLNKPIDGEQEKELITNEKGIANIKNLPVGKYTVKEISAPNWVQFDPMQSKVYEFEVKDDDITGTELKIENKIETISISVEKQWMGKAGTKAEIILLGNDQEVARKDLIADIHWKHTFENLPKYDVATGEEIKYTVTETPLEGYTTTVTGDAAQGFNITNTITGKVSVGVTKKWVGPAKDSVTVKLMNGDQEVASQVLNEENKWQHTFAGLDKYDANGAEIQYTIAEVQEEGYDSQITGSMADGFVVTNVNTAKISIPVTKQWVGQPANAIKVTLLADGVEQQTVTIKKTDDWKHTFIDLPKYTAEGKEIVYTVHEEPIAGYTSVISGTAQDGFILTNSQNDVAPTTPSSTSTKSPITGDNSNMSLYLLLMFISTSGMSVLLILKKARKK